MFGLTDRGRRIIRLRLFLPKTTTFARLKKKKKKVETAHVIQKHLFEA